MAPSHCSKHKYGEVNLQQNMFLSRPFSRNERNHQLLQKYLVPLQYSDMWRRVILYEGTRIP